MFHLRKKKWVIERGLINEEFHDGIFGISYLGEFFMRLAHYFEKLLEEFF